MDSNQKGICSADSESWYWEYNGEKTLLLGGTNTDNLFQWAGSGLVNHLDQLVEIGGNYVRNTLSDRGGNDVFAFAEVRDGIYDLERWNENYWNRLETFLEETAKRDIVVQLTLWDQHDLKGPMWDKHPWNPYNNVNYGRYESGVTGGRALMTPVNRNTVVYPYLRRFVDRVLDISLNYNHILYNINNESNSGEAWECHWAQYINKRADELNKHVDVTTMNMWPGQSVATVLRNSETFSFVELSQVNQHSKGYSGQEHWDVMQSWREEIADTLGPRPLNHVKIYGGLKQSDNFGSAVEATQRLWRNVLGGCASARFHRPMGIDGDAGIGLSKRARLHIRSVRAIADAVDIFALEPRTDLLSNRSPNEAYCAATPGKVYVAYFLDGGMIEIDISDVSGTADVRWFDVDNSEWTSETTMESSVRGQLSTPDDGNWVAVIQA